MRVRTLQLYLRSLHAAVAATEAGSSVPAELEAAAARLQPFADLDLAQFAAFLQQAEEYRTSGTVAVPPHLTPHAEQLQTALRDAEKLANHLHTQDFPAQRERVQGELETALAALLQPLGLGIAVKSDAKALKAAHAAAATRATAARVRTLVTSLRETLAGVKDEAALNAPDLQQKLAALTEPAEMADLKAAALDLGVSKPPTKKPALVTAIVTHLTGVKPSIKRTPRPAPTVDAAVVQQHAVRLKELLEKSVDPDAMSEAEVDAAVAEFDKLSGAELQAIAKEAALENAGKSKKEIVQKIRTKLTEARRARQSIEV
jgi:plasmid stabilization system protein ParE